MSDRHSLLVDIGNTRTKYVFCDKEGHLSEVSILQGDIEPLIKKCQKVLVASVNNPEEVQRFDLVAKHLEVAFQTIETTANAFGVKCPYQQYHKLGVDRWLCALAVAKRTQKAVAIIDAGTAATCDFVFEGKYLGGWIAPGFQLMRNALVSNTANVTADNMFPNALEIGTDTEECVNAGCLAMLSGFIEQAEQKIASLSTDYTLIISGGSADMLAKMTKNQYSIEHDLVFQGLKLYL